MHVFTSNPPARGIPPVPVLKPSEGYMLRDAATEAQLQRLEAHMVETGQAASAVGRRIANDSRLIYDLRAGRNLSDKLDTKIDAFFGETVDA